MGARFAPRRVSWIAGMTMMLETMAENLTERERACLEHLRQAEELQVSFAEYCRSFQLNVNEWYGVKQSLIRKGVVPSSRPKGSEETEEKGVFVPVCIAPVSAVAPATGCRIRHPSGWVIECASLPDAQWMSTLMAASRA
jgi:hypothetical protein